MGGDLIYPSVLRKVCQCTCQISCLSNLFHYQDLWFVKFVLLILLLFNSKMASKNYGYLKIFFLTMSRSSLPLAWFKVFCSLKGSKPAIFIHLNVHTASVSPPTWTAAAERPAGCHSTRALFSCLLLKFSRFEFAFWHCSNHQEPVLLDHQWQGERPYWSHRGLTGESGWENHYNVSIIQR